MLKKNRIKEAHIVGCFMCGASMVSCANKFEITMKEVEAIIRKYVCPGGWKYHA